MCPIWLDEQISSLTFTMQWTFCPATFGCPAILFKSFRATKRKSEKFEISQFLNFFPICQVGGCCEGNITYGKNLSHLTFARYLLAKFLANPFNFHGLLNFVTKIHSLNAKIRFLYFQSFTRISCLLSTVCQTCINRTLRTIDLLQFWQW